MNSIELLTQERKRQIEQEGWTLEHDDEHEGGELALLAAAYALTSRGEIPPIFQRQILGKLSLLHWPFKPKDPIRDLVRAGALILAEIERLQRKQP